MPVESSKNHASTGTSKKQEESPKKKSGHKESSRSSGKKPVAIEIPKKPEDLSKRAEVKEYEMLWAQKEEQEENPAVKEYLRTLKSLAKSEENAVVKRHLLNKNGGPSAIPIPLRRFAKNHMIAQSPSESEAGHDIDETASDSSDPETVLGKIRDKEFGNMKTTEERRQAKKLAKTELEKQKNKELIAKAQSSNSTLTKELTKTKKLPSSERLPFSERLKKDEEEKAERRRRRAKDGHRSHRRASSRHGSDVE